MSGAAVSLSWGKLPNGYCWPNPEDYKNDIFNLLVGTLGAINGIVISANTPASADNDKLWLKTDDFGLPLAFYKFQGQWLWPHPVGPSEQSRIIWMGSEAALWSYDGGDGSEPSASAPTPTTGAMWQRDIKFGDDTGTVNPFRFPVGIGTNIVAYDGNQKKIINPGETGGVERHTLAVTEIPAHHHTYTLSSAGVIGPFGSGTETNVASANTGDTGGGVSHLNMPPWIGVIFAKRTARKFYTAS